MRWPWVRAIVTGLALGLFPPAGPYGCGGGIFVGGGSTRAASGETTEESAVAIGAARQGVLAADEAEAPITRVTRLELGLDAVGLRYGRDCGEQPLQRASAAGPFLFDAIAGAVLPVTPEVVVAEAIEVCGAVVTYHGGTTAPGLPHPPTLYAEGRLADGRPVRIRSHRAFTVAVPPDAEITLRPGRTALALDLAAVTVWSAGLEPDRLVADTDGVVELSSASNTDALALVEMGLLTTLTLAEGTP